MFSIYQSGPEPAPDSEFVDGELRHLVVGNRGRLRDVRRTPLRVTAVMPAIGGFEVEIEAFEDRGARWQLPLMDVGRLQFPRDARRAPEWAVAQLRAAAVRFDRPLEVPIDPGRRVRTLARIADRRMAIQHRFVSRVPQIDLAEHIRRREGHERLGRLFGELLDEQGLTDVDEHFARSFVSNPYAGEVVKGHAIVLAELGLCPYNGTIVRDSGTFAEPWTKSRREEHLITRLAATEALWAALGRREITLYRGAASEGPLRARPPASFVSATFSEEVARAHYAGGPATQAAILCRQRVPIARLLMTFLETPAMNDPYREAEAVLIGEPDNAGF